MSEFSRTELVSVLDRDIDRVLRESQRPGWTPWAVLLSLAALLAIIGKDVESSSTLRGWMVMVIAIVGGAAFDMWGFFRGGVSLSKQSHGSALRFAWPRVAYSENRVYVVIELVRSILIVLCTLKLMTHMPALAVYAYTCIGTFGICATTIYLLFTYQKDPLVSFNIESMRPSVIVVSRTIMLIISIAGLSIIVAHVAEVLKSDPSIPEIRTGISVVACAYLIGLLYRAPSDGSVAKEMLRIRNDIAYGSADMIQASKELHLLRNGATAGDVLQKSVVAFCNINAMFLLVSQDVS